MNKLLNRVDTLYDSIIKAQGDLIELAWAMEAEGLTREPLSKTRDALATAHDEVLRFCRKEVFPQ